MKKYHAISAILTLWMNYAIAFEMPRVTAFCLHHKPKISNTDELSIGTSGKLLASVDSADARFYGWKNGRKYIIDTRQPDGRRRYPLMLILTAATWATQCGEWSHCDLRMGRVTTMTNPPTFFVGIKSNEFLRPEKAYEVYGLSRQGTPMEGRIEVQVPPGNFSEQKKCLEKLKDIEVQWINFDADSQEVDSTIRMTVNDVLFTRMARREGR